MVLNPELREKPLGIKQKNFLVTCNYKARSLGVKKCMTVKDALELLPDMVLVDGSDLTNYRQCSAEISSVAHTFTPLVERLGMDENFLDVTDRIDDYLQSCNGIDGHYYGDQESNATPPNGDPCGCGCYKRLIIGTHIASNVRKKIFDTTGITCCAGVAHNKLLAKLVSGYHKPNQQTVIFPWQACELMNSLKDVRCIPGIGSVTSKTLGELNIVSVQDLQNVDIKTLKNKFGDEVCKKLKDLSFAIDEGPVRVTGQPQSIGLEDAFMKVTSLVEVKTKYQTLLERLLKLLEVDGREPAALKVSVRKYDIVKRYGQRETKQVPISSSFFAKGVTNVSTNVKTSLINLVIGSFQKIVDTNKPFHLTLVGLGFTKFIIRSPGANLISHFFQKRSHDQMEEKNRKNEAQMPATRTLTSVNSMEFKRSKKLLMKPEEICGSKEIEQMCFGDSDIEEECFSGVDDKTLLDLSSYDIAAEQKNYKVNQEKIDVRESKCFNQEKIDVRESKCFNQEKIDVRESKCFNHQPIVCSKLVKNNSPVFVSEDTSLKSLPDGIDVDVFNALPKEIQEEVLQSYRNDMNSKSMANQVFSPKESKHHSYMSLENSLKPLQVQNSKCVNFQARKEGLQDLTHKVLSENEPSCSYAPILSESMVATPSCADKFMGDMNCLQKDILLPEGIDPDVFSALPKELQKEILDEKGSQRNLSSPRQSLKSASHKKKNVHSSPILKYLKKM